MACGAVAGIHLFTSKGRGVANRYISGFYLGCRDGRSEECQSKVIPPLPNHEVSLCIRRPVYFRETGRIHLTIVSRLHNTAYRLPDSINPTIRTGTPQENCQNHLRAGADAPAASME